MKKTLSLIIGLLVAAGIAKAQNVSMDFIPYHYPGYGISQFQNKVLQQRNGELVANLIVAIPSGDIHVLPTIVGNKFYRVSPTTLQFTDSLLLADIDPKRYLFAQDPRGEGNLRVNIEPDDNGGTALRISHFPDDDLNINHDEDVVVALFDSEAIDCRDSYMIDSQGDLIVKFYSQNADGSYVCHIARYGLDGTLKHATTLPESQNFVCTMEEFESSPKQYYQWKVRSNQNMGIYVFDSTFQMTNSYIINKELYNVFHGDPYFARVVEVFSFGDGNINSTFVVPDGEDVLVAAPFIYDSAWMYDFQECGVAVARYNLTTMQRKALAHFNDWPGPLTISSIMCLQKTSDGNVYLVYRELDPQNTPHMVAVKMDGELNMIWKRYCYEPHSLKVDPNLGDYSGILKDENGNESGIYVAGYSYNYLIDGDGFFFFFLTDEGLDVVNEGGMEVRPYLFYPNPAQNELHLQYSPDVTPKTIELYDLQGRLVRSQRNGLESLNLQGLSAGQYVMKVTMEGGKVFSDKVIKE